MQIPKYALIPKRPDRRMAVVDIKTMVLLKIVYLLLYITVYVIHVVNILIDVHFTNTN